MVVMEESVMAQSDGVGAMTESSSVEDLEAAGETADLTSRARIRNAALHQFASRGFAGTPLRAIAAEAGVAIGLISHHFGSKEGTRDGVDRWIVGLFSAALERADGQADGSVADAGARDEAVARMLEDNPLVIDYLRREVLEQPEDGGLITRLSALTVESVDAMRAAGHASTDRDRVEQVLTVMVRQLGRLVLQPLLHQVAAAFPAGERPASLPELTVEVRKSGATGPGSP